MVFNATFNNISVISSLSVLLVEETGIAGKTTDLSQVNDKFITICCIEYTLKIQLQNTIMTKTAPVSYGNELLLGI
jgi:hypothetical protein